ncbi:hypothetical protein AB0J83_28620 [Actinoplanes sp. NPDC049596]|uniref:hypothetical protein n=1 Tax=unclassified Actinoplanes TaxID=2626549 RepID=UPI003414A192
MLYHQGGWICSAAPAALPFLLDLAEGRAVHHRAAVVELIARLVHEAGTVEDRFIDEAWPAAFEAAVPRMLALLADHDPQVRREALHLVSARGLPAGAVAAALWEREAVEDDRVARRDLVLAFGEVGGHEAYVREVLDDPADPQRALAALLALGSSVAPARLTQAVAALRDPAAADWSQSAWYGGGHGARPVIHAVGQLRRDDPAAAAFTLALADNGSRDERVAGLDQAAALLARWRSVGPDLTSYLVGGLSDEDAEVRLRPSSPSWTTRVRCTASAGCWGPGVSSRPRRAPADRAAHPRRGRPDGGQGAGWHRPGRRRGRPGAAPARREARRRVGYLADRGRFRARPDRPFRDRPALTGQRIHPRRCSITASSKCPLCSVAATGARVTIWSVI